MQGQGPLGSAVRIILKIHQYTFNRVGNAFSRDGLGLGSKKKDEELRGKAIKVIDLLQHSTELGNMDALFTLAHVSLVRVCTRHSNKMIINLGSFLLPNTSRRIPNWHTNHFPLMPLGLEMRPPKLIWHSSMLRVIKELYPLIKEKPSYILHLPRMVATRAHK